MGGRFTGRANRANWESQPNKTGTPKSLSLSDGRLPKNEASFDSFDLWDSSHPKEDCFVSGP